MSEDDRNSNKMKLQDYEAFEMRLRKSLRIDPRYSVFDVRYSKNFLNIFTDSVENAIHISRFYRKESRDVLSTTNPRVRIKVVLLPDKSVGKSLTGICHVGVAPVRRLAASSSEQVTQVLYGETFDALQVLEGWTRVKLHADGYVGWVSSNQVTLFQDDEFDKYGSLPSAFVVERVLPLFEKPKVHSRPIREAVFGCQLKMVEADGGFLKVRLPDSIYAYAQKSGISSSSLIKKSSVKSLIQTARNFQGISYVWGGRSSMGFDCSGFVQTVFRLNGIELLRDASDQYSSGKFLGKNLKRVRPGDLLFFSPNGDKISHVAIYIGQNKEFIHSSGFVKINSFDPHRENFSRKLFTEFVGACRVIS
jgi:gamma-D-glutamyl-L-lysine dipeptidyl-peptidase